MKQVFNLVEYLNKLYLFEINLKLNFDLSGIITFDDHYYVYGQNNQYCWIERLNQLEKKNDQWWILCSNKTSSSFRDDIQQQQQPNLLDCDRLNLIMIEQSIAKNELQYYYKTNSSSTSKSHTKTIVLICVIILILIIMTIVVGFLHYCTNDHKKYVHAAQGRGIEDGDLKHGPKASMMKTNTKMFALSASKDTANVNSWLL